MKKFLFPLLLGLVAATPLKGLCDVRHAITTSTQLTVNGAYTDASRIGSTYAVSGSNIKVATDQHF